MNSRSWITRPQWNTVGVALAVVAGMFTLGTVAWPAVPQGPIGNLGALWGIGAFAIGLGYIAAIFLSERWPVIALALLFGGAVVQGGAGILFGSLLGPFAAFVDLFPALLALGAGLILLRSPRQSQRSPAALNDQDQREAA